MLYKIRCLCLAPVLLLFRFSSNSVRKLLCEDLESYCLHFMSSGVSLPNNINNRCLYVFVHSRSFRTIFYSRVNPISSRLLKLIWKGENSFSIDPKCSINGGFYAAHAYSTIINARSIGKNFTCRNCTTIGNKVDGRNDLVPIIGDNVVLGSNVVIVGNITIGNDVIIGAGAVVVKNVPDSCVVVGNPMRIIKK